VSPAPLARFERGEGPAARVVLDNPARHNALTPELLDDLRDALRKARESDARALVLAGHGRSFSTGGDVAAFLAHAQDADRLRAYAERVVQTLNEAILDLLRLPIPVLVRVQGAATGGAAGIVLASDIALFTPEAFIQPWYGTVGFAPDGGWTALMAERIGASRAVAAQALNRRFSAADALRLGIADEVVEDAEIDARLALLAETIAGQDAGTLAAARAMVWDAARLGAVAQRLEAEKRAFVDRIARPEVVAGMRAFVARKGQKTPGGRTSCSS
jgi:2-(1,2-epoxy-1,2-dihydrophenyl)acetyl-CoA isomerase